MVVNGLIALEMLHKGRRRPLTRLLRDLPCGGSLQSSGQLAVLVYCSYMGRSLHCLCGAEADLVSVAGAESLEECLQTVSALVVDWVEVVALVLELLRGAWVEELRLSEDLLMAGPGDVKCLHLQSDSRQSAILEHY